MLDSIIVPEGGTSDNCTFLHKSVQHFHHLQKLATELKTTIIRIYGIAGHGKNEVDYCEGVVKIKIRSEICRGENFQGATVCRIFVRPQKIL